MKLTIKRIWRMLREAMSAWVAHDVSRYGAALAFYTILAISPLLIIVVAIGGLFFDAGAARTELLGHIRELMGPAGSEAAEAIMRQAAQPGTGVVATTIAGATLLVGATSVFVELQEALNAIWGVKPRPGRGVVLFIRKRLLSFAMVLGIGFLLLVSLLFSASLSVLSSFFRETVAVPDALWGAVYALVSFLLITILFAMIYKILPDMKIAWRDVWLGALITSALFTAGKYALGLYLGRSSVVSAYGAAGSLVVVVLWVYYSSQIVFFGAELTRVYAFHREGRIDPEPGAVRTAPGGS